MQLPNAEDAIIDRKKVTHYLLSTEHPDGRAKSRFFGLLGFSCDEPDRLIRALLRMAAAGTVAEEVVTPFGRKYIVNGMLEAPNGWAVNIRSVWIVRKSETAPRFVTAYPR